MAIVVRSSWFIPALDTRLTGRNPTGLPPISCPFVEGLRNDV
jgi:hypothetical protein